VREAIKPDLTAQGGNWVFDRGPGALISDPAVEIVSTSARFPNALLATSVGTSFAAPEVTHLAGLLQMAYPGLSANAIRVLQAQAASHEDALIQQFSVFDDSKESSLHALCGYGTPNFDRAATSSDSRVVLYSEDEVRPDAFHVYR
jgi:subtilisin family serine protease